ncbi:Transposon Tf2-6 polyprotein [Dictyocoela muelleri]|nr:Transposon Tf2-6 polyprotein [Dictyocoela muelleri]
MDTRYISPAFFVKKSNGKLRLIVDYRNFNKVTTKAHNYRPKISEIFSKLHGCKYFSKIDLNQGFYQIQIKESDIEKTGFRILGKTYVFTRMPFGLTNAPFTFQLALSKIIQDILNSHFYIDDILVAPKSFETHVEDVKTVLKALLLNKVSVNYEKSEFGKTEISYLGHLINQDGTIPEISRLDNLNLKIPKTKKQLERLLGLINWFRPYIPNISEMTASLHDKLKTKKRTIKWDKDDNVKLEMINNEIKKQHTLHFPDFDKEFDLKCDASDIGIGSILSQNGKAVGFYSRKFRGSEQNYTVVEKETLGILESLKHFKPVIFGSKVNIFTDNKNLTFRGDISKRINRWLLMLEEFDKSLQHLEADNNKEADILSRSYNINANLNEIINTKLHKMKTLISTLIKLNKDECEEDNKKLIKETLIALHLLLSHPGKNKLYATIKNYIKINNLKRFIDEICKNCDKCLEEKSYKSTKVRTKFVTEPYNRSEIIAIDIKGPIKTIHFDTKRIKKETYIVAITDLFSRFTETSFIHNIHSSTICNVIENTCLKIHPVPKKCLTDNVKQFTSGNFNQLMNKYNIKHIRTFPHNPTGNAIIERINQKISLCLRLSRSLSIQKASENIYSRLNLTNNSNLGFTPYEVFFKKPLFDHITSMFEIDDEKIKNNALIKQRKWSERKIPGEVKFHVNDLIYLKTHHQDKVLQKYEGPYVIKRITKSGNNAHILKGNKLIKVALKNLKLFKKGEDESNQKTSLKISYH